MIKAVPFPNGNGTAFYLFGDPDGNTSADQPFEQLYFMNRA